MPTYSLTRYRVTDIGSLAPGDDGSVSLYLRTKGFRGIDDIPDATFFRGWVEKFDSSATSFAPSAFRFGPVLAFTLRQDSRKVASKTVARYCAIREAEYLARVGRRPNTLAMKEIREAVKSELLAKAPVNTELMDVVWFPDQSEVWLMAQGVGRREAFESLWRETFGGSLEMLAPFARALEMKPGAAHNLKLDGLTHFIDRWAETMWLGRDFLLWLWHYSEVCGNLLTLDGNALELQFGGRLVLAKDQDKVTCSGIREDWPEAHTAVLEGKHLDQGRLTIQTETMRFSLTLDADSLMPKAVRVRREGIPDADEERDGSRVGEFLDHISLLQELNAILDILFRVFLDLRLADRWEAEILPAVKSWADDRRTNMKITENAIAAKMKHLDNRFARLERPPA